MKRIRAIILSLAYCTLGSGVVAQVDLHNNGILFISTNSDVLYIDGTLTNQGTAALTNHGNIYVTRNLSNAQALMPTGTGTLHLSGNVAQVVSGTQPYRSYNLVTNNAAGFILNNTLTVSGNHSFVAGIITTSAVPNNLLYEPGSDYSGDGDNRHVLGWVSKSGSTSFVFPVGNGTVERTIGISALTAPSIFHANYPGPTTDATSRVLPLRIVDPNEYWIVNKQSGGNAVVNMNWDNAKVPMPNYAVPDLRVANFISSSWTEVGGNATGLTSATGNISSGSLSSFGPFTFGSISFVLPAHVLSFNAYKSVNDILIKWTSADEADLAYYEPLRSDDGNLFVPVDRVQAKNLPGVFNYELRDARPLKGITYYKLRSVDRDGNIELSKTVVINGQASFAPELTVVNPSRSSIQAFARNMDGVYQYTIATVNGQHLQSGYVPVLQGNLTIPLNAGIAKGIYFLQIQKGSTNVVKKIMIER